MFFCGSQTKSLIERRECRTEVETENKGARGFRMVVSLTLRTTKRKTHQQNRQPRRLKNCRATCGCLVNFHLGLRGCGTCASVTKSSPCHANFFSSLHSDFTSSIIIYGVSVDEDCRSVFVSLTCFQLCNRLVPLTYFDTVKFILH